MAPGTRFDFTNRWQLQTCLKSPSVVQGAALQTYASPHFFLDANSSPVAIVFVTPDNATAVTTHSSHPRTEMRDISVEDWGWPTSFARIGAKDTHILRARCAVDHVPSKKPQTIIAQIHGSVDEEIAKVVKLLWTNFTVEARVKNRTTHEEFGLPLGTYSYGTVLEYEIEVASSGVLRVSVNGKTVEYVPPINTADKFYFKAGNYDQCNVECDPHDYARARFWSFNTTHGGTLHD